MCPKVAVGKFDETQALSYILDTCALHETRNFSWREDVTGCSIGECKQRASHWWNSFGGAS